MSVYEYIHVYETLYEIIINVANVIYKYIHIYVTYINIYSFLMEYRVYKM